MPSLTTAWPSRCGTSDTSGLLHGVRHVRITKPGSWRRQIGSPKRQNQATCGPLGPWSVHSRARESDWFHGLCWIKRATLLRTHLESLSSWQNCFVPSLVTGSRLTNVTTLIRFPCFAGINLILRSLPWANVQAALEPLCGQLKMGKATGPDCIPNEILRGASQNFLSTFDDLVVRVLQEGAPASWRGGMMTPVPKQAKKPMGHDNARGVLLSSTLGKLYAKYFRSDATRHVQSAVLPTQLGGFSSKTIEFGNHLVYKRAAVYRQKGSHRQSFFSRHDGDWGPRHGCIGLLQTGTHTPSFAFGTRSGPTSSFLGSARATHWQT